MSLLSDHLALHWLAIASVWLVEFSIACVMQRATGISRINRQDNRVILRQVIINQLCAAPVLVWLNGAFEPGPLLDYKNIIKVPLCIVVAEVIFYYTHQLFHRTWLNRFHIKHHSRPPSTAATFYCHPVEMIALNIAPLALGAMFAGLNWSTMRLLHAAAMINTMLYSHSEYSSGPHTAHHHNAGQNFGIIGLLDTLHSTRG
jgi:sterol desaturase/sphingolipid hydroxylase (fatty acid hydroxylase superfamily)